MLFGGKMPLLGRIHPGYKEHISQQEKLPIEAKGREFT
jgi:hypothetical protein